MRPGDFSGDFSDDFPGDFPVRPAGRPTRPSLARRRAAAAALVGLFAAVAASPGSAGEERDGASDSERPRRAPSDFAPGDFALAAEAAAATADLDRDAPDNEPQGGDELARDRDDLDRGAGRVADDRPPPPPESLARRILGPPAPAAGESARRSDDGRVTLRAWPLAEPVTVDGVLDDPVYDEVPAAEGFLQQEPLEGAPVSEPTRVWVFYDRDSLYVSADLQQRRDRIIGGEMRRDHRNIGWQDSFSVILDTFYDRRNGFLFHTNEQGGLFDAQVTDERNTNSDWNTVWYSEGAPTERGWSVEMRIPFRSLRYASGGAQLWGINFRRLIKHRNERAFFTPLSQAYSRDALLRLSEAATLVGLVAPPGSRRMELKPYAIGGQAHRPLDSVTNDLTGDFGADFKFGVTEGLTADLTWNTDFAQVEDDESQVNLSRFSLYFPEKREFFLEGQGVFDFGGRESRAFGGPTDIPIPFFSRSIGISGSSAVPILGGARLHGRAGAYSMGLLNIQTQAQDDLGVDATNFSAFRVKRDIFSRSNIGVIATHRSFDEGSGGPNTLYGVDGNFAPTEHLRINTFYMATRDSNTESWGGIENASYLGQVRYDTDLIGVSAERLYLGDLFDPGMGFVRRRDFVKTAGSLKLAPRPSGIDAIRQFEVKVDAANYDRPDGELETREYVVELRTIFESSDRLVFDYSHTEERLLDGFDLVDEVGVPAGEYRFSRGSVRYWLGSHRPVSGYFRYQFGDFFGGDRRELSYWGRTEVHERLALEPNLGLNWIRVPAGEVQTTLARVRASYTISPRSYFGALVQYNSAAEVWSANLRYRWEYSPGSDLFVVFSTNREADDGLSGEVLGLTDRTLVVKFTRLFRF